MKSLSLAILPQLCTLFHHYFPKTRQTQLWHQVQPHAYPYTLKPGGLVLGLMMAYLARASGLRQLTERHGELLGTTNFSSLSPALSRPVTGLFVSALRAVLEEFWTPGPMALVALDSMALTLKKGYRHHCARYNDDAVGGGVIWAYLVNAAAGVCPLKVLDFVRGAWGDAKALRRLPLLAAGPLYLMDRGFYSLELVQQWLGGGVHFIVRAKMTKFTYLPLCELSAPRRLSPRLRLEWDGVARMGGQGAPAHPLVRLVMARLNSGELLVLLSDQWLWSAEQICEAYRQRWHIERWHKLLKDALGLAHLYNFSQSGLELQIQVAALLAVLLFLGAGGVDADEPTIKVMRRALRAAHNALGLGTPWRRNCCTVTHARKEAKRRARVKKQANH